MTNLTSPPRSTKDHGWGGTKANLLLAAILFAVSTFAYWYEFKRKPALERATEEKGQLFPIDQSREIESVRIVDKEKKIDVDLRCRARCKLSDPNSDWALLSPLAFKADESNVGTFVSSLAAAAVQETIPLEGDPEEALKAFGLAKDRRDGRRVALKFKTDPEPYVVHVGADSAVGENMYVYVKRANEPDKPSVRIIPSHIRASMQRELTHWRAKRVFDVAVAEVTGFTLTNPAGRTDVRKEGSDWYLSGKRLADSEAVDTYLTGLSYMHAREYVSEDARKDAAKLGIGGKAHYSLALHVRGKPSLTLNVYEVKKDKLPRILASRGDRSYVIELDRTNAEKFTKKSDSFRFRNLLTPAEKELVSRVRLKLLADGKKAETFEFEREGAAWKLTAGKIDGFDPASMDQALTKIGAARIADFLGQKPVPQGNREMSSWTLTGKDGHAVRELSIHGTTEQGEYYALLPKGEIAKLERGSGSVIPSRVTDFLKTPAGKK